MHPLDDAAECLAFEKRRDMAIFAIAATDGIGGRDDARPDRCRRALGHAFQAESGLTRRDMFGVDLVDPLLQRAWLGIGIAASSVAIPPGCTAVARMPPALWRRSNSTANRILAVFERP
ncbi:MAG: hypothetical protein WDN49_14550 [Acetobacteraceae bacterium]